MMTIPLSLGGVNFHHRTLQAAGLRFHIVEGGFGTPLVLLAGFPQSWYAWRRTMPLLAQGHRVIAVDLPGQGDSENPIDGFDTHTTGERLNRLLAALHVPRYHLIAHDIGAWVAYPYAARFTKEVISLTLLDANIPGLTLKPTIDVSADSWKAWHFLFHMVLDLPEALIAGRERTYIDWFFRQKTYNPQATFSELDLDEYERVLKIPGNLRAALSYYRAVLQDIEQNKRLTGHKLTVPILALGGAEGMSPHLYDAMKPHGEIVEGGAVGECGHYMPEEHPLTISSQILDFVRRHG
jgi:pimeloyl-ACP methyl ester carboxylesterase